uniref:PSI domain-containing protein n=1 Tax=Lotus japonicus TaxID=34305 RepID=I3S4G3_LOTJA|nr:unknown [Lotus japonicus]
MVFSIFNSNLLFIFLFLLVCQPSHGVAEDSSTRRLFGSSRAIPSCGELVLKSQCSQNSKCSWCTSQDLDDMCFSKSEALRLPNQVFSCGSVR